MKLDKIVQNWAALWQKENTVDVRELFHPDVRYQDMTLGIVLLGIDAVSAFRASYYEIYPDLVVETSHFSDGTNICLAWTATGTQSADREGLPSKGRRMTIDGLSWIVVADGMIISSRDYWDRETAWKQLR